MSDWMIYRGQGEAHGGIAGLPPPPKWRTFDRMADSPVADVSETGWTENDRTRGASYRASEALLKPVNAALYLRRPLLVRGRPGVGKSTLAYSVAFELGLGPVLRWPITSASSLKDGLYSYDAVGRLQDVHLGHPEHKTDISLYLRLGPLGTALLPWSTPRVLLIDEIDKADIDLPNDLLTTFEEGEYEIPELVRIADTDPEVEIPTADKDSKKPISGGRVRCRQFPFVVMTTNDERQFPPAFLRRCLRLDIEPPGFTELENIVTAQLGAERCLQATELIRDFQRRSEQELLATDQLFNAIHLVDAIALTCRQDLDPHERDALIDLALDPLTRSN